MSFVVWVLMRPIEVHLISIALLQTKFPLIIVARLVPYL